MFDEVAALSAPESLWLNAVGLICFGNSRYGRYSGSADRQGQSFIGSSGSGGDQDVPSN